jgi:hypothetical protein
MYTQLKEKKRMVKNDAWVVRGVHDNICSGLGVVAFVTEYIPVYLIISLFAVCTTGDFMQLSAPYIKLFEFH